MYVNLYIYMHKSHHQVRPMFIMADFPCKMSDVIFMRTTYFDGPTGGYRAWIHSRIHNLEVLYQVVLIQSAQGYGFI